MKPLPAEHGFETAGVNRVPGFDPDIRRTIVVIDESPRTRSQIVAALAPDHDIIEAGSGLDGLGLILERQPDLILLEVRHGEDDGLELCRSLKSDSRSARIPVIIMTSAEEHSLEAEGLQVGAVDFVTRPIDPAILRLRVRNQLALKYYRDALEHISVIDSLTGAANRRQFENILDREWRRAKRLNKPVSLVMFDIDHFKNFNDHYGYPKGDDCLQRLAHLLEAMIHRPGDSAARYGGEEFAIILPETEATGAAIVAERVRQGVELLDIRHEASTVAKHVTISVGVATLVPGAEDGPEILVRLANDRLSDAKTAGRNCTR
jgi:diguanylate cyclase (GGDEF)-like protein